MLGWASKPDGELRQEPEPQTKRGRKPPSSSRGRWSRGPAGHYELTAILSGPRLSQGARRNRRENELGESSGRPGVMAFFARVEGRDLMAYRVILMLYMSVDV